MAILLNTTIVAMIQLNLLQMVDTCETLLSLRINISVATTFMKAYIQYFPLSTLLVQNTGSNQAKIHCQKCYHSKNG